MTGPDPHARRLFEELAAEHLGQPGIGRRRMFGRDGLSADGRFFAFLDRNGLVVRVPSGTTEALLAAGEAEVATSVSPTMRKWVLVPPPADPDRWRRLLAEARAYAGVTPPR